MDQVAITESYKKGTSASDAGIRYQIKLLTVFLLRGISQMREFKLATEMVQEDAGKFDDVIFSYTNEHSEKESILLQAKHKLSESNKISIKMLSSLTDKDFGLCKYLHSYLDSIKYNDGLGKLKGLILYSNHDIENNVGTNLIEMSTTKSVVQFIKMNESGSFFTLSQTFMVHLRESVIKHQCHIFAKYVVDCIMSGNNIKLTLSNNVLKQLESALLYSFFQCTSLENKQRISGLQVNETANQICLTFKNALESELKRRAESSHNKSKNHLTCLEDLNMHFHKVNVYVDGDISNVNGDYPKYDIICDDILDEFRELFILATNQPNVQEMDDCIKDLLKQHPFFQHLSVDSAAKHLDDHVRKWFNQRNGEYLNQINGSYILNNVLLELLSSMCINKCNPTNLCFSEDYINKFSDKISATTHSIIHITSKLHAKVIVTLLHKSLPVNNNYLYLDVTLVKNKQLNMVDVMNVLVNNHSLSGVICYASDLETLQSFVCVSQLKRAVPEKTIFMVSQNHSQVLNNSTIEEYKTVHVDILFENLSIDSQHNLFQIENINFHGISCSLSNVVCESEFCKYIDSTIFNELITQESFVIGESHQSVCDLPSAFSNYHLQISLERFITLLSQDEYKFVVSGDRSAAQIKIQMLNLFIDHRALIDKCIEEGIIIFEDKKLDPFWNRNEFQNICKKHRNTIIFWIELNHTSLFLQQIYNPLFYIERKFKFVESIEIKQIREVLKSEHYNNKMCFVISGTSETQLMDVLKFSNEELRSWMNKQVIIIDDGTLPDDIYHNFDQIHWIKYEDNKLLWIRSHGSLNFVRQDNIFNIRTMDEKQFAAKVNNELVIISDDAGMGKSTVLTSIAQYISESPAKWVIRINFKETEVQQRLLVLSSTSITLDNILNFFGNIEYLNMGSLLAQILLKYYLQTENNRLILIFDGFDEIPVDIQETAKSLVTLFIEKVKCTVYVATRQHYTPLIEEQYSVFATRLQEISIEEQYTYLVKYWKNHLTLISEIPEDLYAVAEDYMNNMASVLKDSLKFIGVPLHLRLVSETSLPYILSGRYRDFLSNNNNIKSLFDHFIEKKYDIYFREKSSYFSNCSHIKMIRNKFNDFHSKLAFQYFFPEYAALIHIDTNTDGQEYANDFLLIGILQAKSMNKGFLFIHRTLAEHYCALFLVNCFRKPINSIVYKTAVDVVRNHLFLVPSIDPFKMLKVFMDSLLIINCPLHNALFHNNLVTLDLLNEDCLHQKDALGRTALHIAAQYGNENAIMTLLNQDCDAFASDVCGRMPLHYAVRYGLLKNIISLTAPFIDINIYHRPLCKEIQSTTDLPKHFFELNEYDKSSLVRMINMRDINKQSSLQYANENKHWEICNWLILHGADCSVLTYEQEETLLLNLINTSCFVINNGAQYDILPVIDLLIRRNSKPIVNLDKNYTVPKMYRNFFRYGYVLCYKFLFKSFDRKNLSYILNTVYNNAYPLDSLHGSTKYLEDLEHMRILNFLLENESFTILNSTAESKQYISACLQNASMCGHLETFKYIIAFAKNKYRDESKNSRSLSYTLFDNNKWMDHFPNINFNTYIGLSTIYNHRNIVEYIWENYRSLTTDTHGNTALIYASDRGNLKFVKNFCENGANVNGCNNMGKTSLHFAAEEKRLDVIKYLVNKGGNVNQVDNTKRTVLDYALKDAYQTLVPKFYSEHFLCIKYLVLECDARSYNDTDITKANRIQIVSSTRKNVNDFVNGTTLLHKAVKMKNKTLVINLLSLGANPNAKDSNGRTPLECIGRPSQLSHILFEYGARCHLHVAHHLSSNYYYHPMMIPGAMQVYDLFTSTSLGSDINTHILDDNKLYPSDYNNPMIYIIKTIDATGQSLVHKAAKNGDKDALAIILDYDKEYIQQRYNYEFTNHYKKLNISHSDDKGNTPLHIAAENGHLNIVNMLLNNGAKYNSINKLGKTPAMIATIKYSIVYLFTKIQQNCLDDVEKALINDDYINVQDAMGRTPLHWAVKCGHVGMVEMLLKKSANKEAADDDQRTPLHYAASIGNVQIVCILLKNGAIFDTIDKFGLMPKDIYEEKSMDINILEIIDKLYISVKKEKSCDKLLNIIKINKSFLEATVYTCDHVGNTLLHYSVQNSNTILVYFILQHGGIYDKMSFLGTYPTSFSFHDINSFKLLDFIRELFYNEFTNIHNVNLNNMSGLTRECIINVRNANRETLLHCVQNMYFIKWLVKYSNNLDTIDNEGKTPLMAAILRNDMYAVKVICNGGASLTKRAFNGDTALHLAVRSGNLYLVKYLVEKRCINITLKNNKGDTPIDIAESIDNEHMLAYLLSVSDEQFPNDSLDSVI